MSQETELFFRGPDFDFEFAVSDALIFNLYSYRILVFKVDGLQGHIRATEALQKGLQNLVKRCPPLGGKVVFIKSKPGEQQGWKKALPSTGIKLVVRDLRSQLNYSQLEAKDFPPSAFKCDQVVPISPAPILEGEAPGSVFQFTWIEGGALLTVGIDHPIADGNAMNTLMGLLAEECRRAQVPSLATNETVSEEAQVLGIDRTPVRSLESKTKANPEDHLAYTFLPEPPGHHEESHGKEPEIDLYMFTITSEKLVELKEAAMDGGHISTHDAICALTWRSSMLARYHAGTIKDLDTTVSLNLPTNCREFMELDRNYVGNAVYFIQCKMPLRELLQLDSLPTIAKMIRAQLEARNHELIAGFHSLVKSLPNLSQMTFGWIPDITTTAFCLGSSWKADQMYGSNWGDVFGPVRRFRSPDVGFFGVFKGFTFICPPIPGTGAAEFQTWLEPAGWEILQKDELFQKYCTRIGV
jgi:hypothetical protein